MRLMMTTVCTCLVEDMGMGTMGTVCWCRTATPLILVKTLEERTTATWAQEVSGRPSGELWIHYHQGLTLAPCNNQASESELRALVSTGLAHRAQDLMV